MKQLSIFSKEDEDRILDLAAFSLIREACEQGLLSEENLEKIRRSLYD